MATCIHGTHWDGVSWFSCPQCEGGGICLPVAVVSDQWEDVRDGWTDAINAAHPTRSGSHTEYGLAMTMVGHRHSKGELVGLVNWLLVRLKTVTPERKEKQEP